MCAQIIYNVGHHVMRNPPKITPPSSKNDIMSNADRIAAALADLESQAIPTKKAWNGMYNVDETLYRNNRLNP